MEYVLHIYVFGTTFSKEFFESNQSLTVLLNFWREHKEIVSHLTVCRHGKYLCTLTNFEDLKSLVSERSL